MKILYITHYTELFGANRSLLALVKTLIKKDWEIHILVPSYGPITSELDKFKIDYSVINFYDEYYYKTGFSRLLGLKRHLLNRLFFNRINNLVEDIKPDIIHSNSASLHIGAKLAEALSKPHVWHIREFGLQDYKALHNLGEANHLKWLNKAAHLIAISHSIANVALKGAKAPMSVIYNGVMSQKEMEKILPPKEKKRVTFTLAGSFREEKGQHNALEAFVKIARDFPQTCLNLPGDASNSYGQQLMIRAKEAGLEKKVLFPGFINDANLLYKDTDVLLMCSENEAMGRVTAEALARYIPVIGFDGGANPELITQGKEGFLYKKEKELLEAMKKLTQSTDLRLRMGTLGHAKAKSMFTEEHYSASVESIYKQVV